jgi:hypothetical protein
LQKDFESLMPSTVRDPERCDQARNPSAKIKEMIRAKSRLSPERRVTRPSMQPVRRRLRFAVVNCCRSPWSCVWHEVAFQVSFRHQQSGGSARIHPNALSSPTVFQRLPVLNAQTRLEFCHSGRDGSDLELREFLDHIFPRP